MSGVFGKLALGAVIAVGTWALLTGAALASYDVVASCNSGGQPVSCGGWHTASIQISWTWTPTDGAAMPGTCTTQSYWYDITVDASCQVTGPEGSGGTVQSIMVEISNPTATASPGRAPDFDGWYNHPVAATVQGSAFSGIQSCTGTTYAGPDSSAATVSGSCTDNAGKVVSATSAPFPYDATPPALDVEADPGDRLVVFRWPVSPDLTLLTIQRTPGVRGSRHSVLHRGDSGVYRDARVRNHIRYRYTITARDQAGNVTVRTLVIRPGPRLLSPGPSASVGTPLLSWTPVRGADYYNVQLFRNHKILSAWPSHAFLQLQRAWRFRGRHYRLTPGRYRWYVWPGFGRRAAAHYGRLIGSSSFVVT